MVSSIYYRFISFYQYTPYVFIHSMNVKTYFNFARTGNATFLERGFKHFSGCVHQPAGVTWPNIILVSGWRDLKAREDCPANGLCFHCTKFF